MMASVARLPQLPAPRGDAALAAVLALPVVGGLAWYAARHDQPAVLALGALALGAVALRRLHPLLAFAVALAAAVALPGVPLLLLPALVVLYGIAVGQTWPPAALAAVTLAGAAALAWLCWGSTPGHDGPLAWMSALVTFCAAAVTLGLYRGARVKVREGVAERDARRARERELLTDRAVGQERLRIAQELHDVVAHNVSLMVVQAQALGATAADDRVTSTTDAIAHLGRQAMAEMHRTLRLLRTDGPAAAQMAPQPGLADLAELLEQSRAAGLPVELVVEGAPRPLPQAADLSAFRIVQEALTNVRKHAAGAPTTVTLSYRPGRLDLAIVDRGPGGVSACGTGAPGPAGGHGLTGMRERAALFGGTLTAARGADAGFAVRATLPYGALAS